MKTKFHYILMTVAMVAMASCSQDEVLIPSAEVQDIRIVVSDFPAFDDAQTRAIGTFDSGKTAWVPDDVIYIVAANKGVDSQILTLTYGADGKWTADGTTIHYLSASDTHIRAIYAPNCEKEDTEIKAKDNLPYGTGEFLEKECFVENGTLTVDFTNYKRPYSRLRIVTEPNEQITVATTLFDPAGYKDADADADAYNYTLTADDKGNAYLYGTFEASGKVEVEGNVNTSHTFTEATDAGNSYALFARRGANLAKLTSTYIINDSETHYFYGSGNYGIKVESGSPTIVLSDANISLKDGASYSSAVNAIDIVAANSTTTIRVEGEHNSITTKHGAGIFVAQNSSVEITSSTVGSRLKINANNSAAIGGYSDINNSQGVNCGHIVIKGITLEAQSNSVSLGMPAAIGSSGGASCGTIKIENAIVYAYGSGSDNESGVPAIGLGKSHTNYINNNLPTINIINSEIHLYRGGNYADYIGKYRNQTITDAGLYFGTNGAVRNSKLYCYTGANATDSDAVIQYDMDGNVVNN